METLELITIQELKKRVGGVHNIPDKGVCAFCPHRPDCNTQCSRDPMFAYAVGDTAKREAAMNYVYFDPTLYVAWRLK